MPDGLRRRLILNMSWEVVTRMSELAWAMFQELLHDCDCDK